MVWRLQAAADGHVVPRRRTKGTSRSARMLNRHPRVVSGWASARLDSSAPTKPELHATTRATLAIWGEWRGDGTGPACPPTSAGPLSGRGRSFVAQLLHARQCLLQLLEP